MLNTNPKHIGLENDLIDTIVEIYLFKNANKIKTYSLLATHKHKSYFQ
jgi:hypothetical protein